MVKINNQQDIVNEFMKTQEHGPFEDEIYLPGLKDYFAPRVPGQEVTEAEWRIHGLEKLAIKPRQEIAEALVGVVDYRTDVVGFRWVRGDAHVTVRYSEGFEQRKLEHEGEYEDMIEKLVLMLKSRANISVLEWNFGEDHVTVTHD